MILFLPNFFFYLKDLPKLSHSEVFQKYEHFSLIFENLDILLESNKDPRVLNFWDNLFLRLFTEENQRTHFPIVVESANSLFFNRVLSEWMHKSDEKMSSIELTGFKNEEDINLQISHIYNMMERMELTKLLGLNFGDWNNVTK